MTAKKDKGFTLPETLVVIAIILILSATVGFSAFKFVGRAKVTACKNQIEENIKKTANGAVTLPITENIPARIFLPDGSTIAPQGIHLVPGGGGVKTAYPVP